MNETNRARVYSPRNEEMSLSNPARSRAAVDPPAGGEGFGGGDEGRTSAEGGAVRVSASRRRW
jgi:hypothetical protein